jgi:transcriptional regulator with XRE-family HTH domain
VNTVLVRRDLLDSLKVDPEYRHAWNLENVYTGVCFQIRALREQREWSQAVLGKEAGMAPERISILEDPNAGTKPTLKTLLRIANACDVGLDVRFVPYSTVIDRSTKTNLKELEVSSFSQELPELEESIAVQITKQESSEAPAKQKDRAVHLQGLTNTDIAMMTASTGGYPRIFQPQTSERTETGMFVMTIATGAGNVGRKQPVSDVSYSRMGAINA